MSEPNGQTEHPEEKITPDYKYGKVDVEKSVTNQTPKLGKWNTELHFIIR